MLSTLKFKQGLADLVLDARGDTADFESEKSKNAFLARVSSLMESQLPSVVRASGTEGENLVAASPKTDPSETSAGMSEPPSASADDLLTPEALSLLARLAEQGLVTLGDEAKRRLAAAADAPRAASAAELRAKAAEKRHKLASAAMEKAERSAKMGDVLSAAGFDEESAAPYASAVALAAGAALFEHAGAADETPEGIPDSVPPVELEGVVNAVESLCLSPDGALTLQFAVQGLPFPDAPRRVRAFLAACAAP